jgi:hypothetical protein
MKIPKSLSGKLLIVLLFGIVFLLSSCAKSEAIAPCLHGHTYGFWGGLLHGFIAPFDLLMMFFRNDVIVYSPNNNGVWYAAGFLIGSGGWGFLGGKGASRKKDKNIY